MKKQVGIVAMLLCLSASAVVGAMITVDASGGGDHTTIQGALAVAMDGDVLEVSPGIYYQRVNITKSIDIIGVGAAGTIILDGEDVNQTMNIEGAYTVALDNLVFQHARVFGSSGVGSAVHVGMGAVVMIDRCRFEENWAGWDCAVSAQGSGTDVTIQDCQFISNYAYHNAPACGVLLYANMTIDGCRFIDNVSPGICGAVASWNADLSVSHSVFIGNSGGSAGALRVAGGNAEFHANTLHDNAGPTVVLIQTTSMSTFTNNIVTTNPEGYGIIDSGTTLRDWNIYYDCASGAIAEASGPNEFEIDPGYCDYNSDDLSLCSLSFALAVNNGFDLIGALGLGCSDCGPVSNEDFDWSELKKQYR